MLVFNWQVVNGLKQRILKLEQHCKEKDNMIKYGRTGRGWGQRALEGHRGLAPPSAGWRQPACPSPCLVSSTSVCSVCSDCSFSPHPTTLCPMSLVPASSLY